MRTSESVGKLGLCAQNGRGSTFGSGLGYPITPTGEIMQKKGFWEFDTDPDLNSALPEFIVSVQHPADLTLHACGHLAPVNATPTDGPPKLNIGASCGPSYGHDGWGAIDFRGHPHYRLRNLGWVAPLGFTLPITGDLWVPHIDGTNGKKRVGKFFALATFLPSGELGSCAGKSSNAKPGFPGEGASRFRLSAPFALYKFKATPFGTSQCKKGNLC